jgi:4-hydroxy-4-methyl-2-oxoglutarate aldolase
MNEQEMLEQLKRFDTPSITNVVATYPKDKELCLGLYNPWETNWYTDQSVKCMYPELGRMAGYVATAVYGPPTPDSDRLSFADVLRAIDKMPKPVILVIQQDLPAGWKNKSGLSGGNMTTALKAIGVIGVISDGPSRDIDEIRPMKFQYMLSGVTAGHGNYAIKAVNVPVRVGSMDVAPGEIVHMDENGAVKFPREYLPKVLELAGRLQEVEITRQAKMAATNDVEKIIRIMSGFED